MIVNRIKELREKCKLTQEAFGKLIGEKQSSVQDVERKKKEASVEFLTKITDTFHINFDWLIKGEGPMLRNESPLMENPPTLVANQIGRSHHKAGLVYVPEYSIVYTSADDGGHVDSEFIDDFAAFRADWIAEMELDPSKVAVIRVSGDSMEPTLENGGLILLDLRDSDLFSTDAIYVFNMDNEIFVKRIQRMGRGQFEILSDNPMYKPRFPKEYELQTLRVVGRVVWAGRRV